MPNQPKNKPDTNPMPASKSVGMNESRLLNDGTILAHPAAAAGMPVMTMSEALNNIAIGAQNKIDHERYKDNPVLYCEEQFPFVLWSKQKQIVESVFNNSVTMVRSGNTTGKTHILGMIVMAWLDIHRPNAKVITTAKNYDSLRFVLWARIREMYNYVSHRFGSPIPKINQTDFVPDPKWEPEWFAIGHTPKIEGTEATGFQGQYAENTLFIVDEAITTPKPILEAIEGSMLAGGSKSLFVFNPTTRDSEMFSMEHSGHADKLIHMSAFDLFDSPEYKENPEAFKKLASPAKVERLLDIYGRNSPIAKARVYGEWPDTDEYSVIKYDKLLLCQDRYDSYMNNLGDDDYEGFITGDITRLIFGWDVAGEGADFNVLGCLSVGDKGMMYKQQSKWSEDKNAGRDRAYSIDKVFELIKERALKALRLLEASSSGDPMDLEIVIVVDAVGEGSGIKATMKHWTVDFPDFDFSLPLRIHEFKGGNTAKKIKERREVDLFNRNAEAWYRTSLVVNEEEKTYLPLAADVSDKLIHQLTTRRKFWGKKHKEEQVWSIQSKEGDDGWKALNNNRSPDEADAFVMAIWGHWGVKAGVLIA